MADRERWPLSAFGDEIASDLENQVSVLDASGVRAVELRSAWGVNVVDLEAEQLARAAELLKSAGFAVSAIGSPVGKAPIDGDFDSEMARLRAALRAAKTLDTKLVRIFSFFVPDGSHLECRDEVLRRMSAFAREANARDLVLVHENESFIYGDNADRCRDVVESVASPALKAAFDPANFVQVGVRPFDEAWPLLAPHVAHFHVKDAVAVDTRGQDRELNLMMSVRPAGEGDGQLPQLVAALEDRDYRGYLVLEPHLHFQLPDMDGAQRFGVALAALNKLLARKP